MIKFVVPVFLLQWMGALFPGQAEPWVAPDTASRQVNPQKVTEKSITQGKKIYMFFCQSCHGINGEGNGAASVALKKKPANFHDSILQNQADGALHWKISEGRGDMASYKNSLSAEQRWNLVNYIRSFKN